MEAGPLEPYPGDGYDDDGVVVDGDENPPGDMMGGGASGAGGGVSGSPGNTHLLVAASKYGSFSELPRLARFTPAGRNAPDNLLDNAPIQPDNTPPPPPLDFFSAPFRLGDGSKPALPLLLLLLLLLLLPLAPLLLLLGDDPECPSVDDVAEGDVKESAFEEPLE